MTRAQLAVAVPDGVWKGDVSRRYPETTIRVRSTALGDATAVELVTVAGPAVEDSVSAVESHPDVTDASVVDRRDREATLHVESGTAPIVRAGAEAGVPVETPFAVADGTASVDVTSTHAGLSALGDRFRALDLEFDVASVETAPEPTELLTEKQRELLLGALEQGYYETPRRCTLTELASSVGIAKSTCSDTLKRAEETVVDYFLRDRRGPTPASPRERSSETAAVRTDGGPRHAVGGSGQE